MELAFSDHAEWRMDQRNISEEAVEVALIWGDRIRSGKGAFTYFLSRNVIKRFPELRHYLGVGVVRAMDGVIITVLRNKNFRPKKVRQRHGNKSPIVHRKSDNCNRS